MKKLFFVVGMFFWIVGCSDDSDDPSDGGSDSDTDNETDGNATGLGGIWSGHFLSDDTQEQLTLVFGLVSPQTNKMYFFDLLPTNRSIIAEGTADLADTAVTASLNTYNDTGAPVGNISLSATLMTMDGAMGFQGTYTGDSNSGFFSGSGKTGFAYMKSLYEHPTTMADVAGTWSFSDEGGTQTTITIDDNGGITGGNGTCVFSGQLSIIHPDYNLGDIQFNIGNCGSPWDGDYTGLGYGQDPTSLTMVISKADFGFVMYFGK
ncbi:MAG: hypothetical protein QNJ97_01925 [Myxococcota bacterium]|nr:hypothetical protein [Myxococcota bacterium]